MENSFNFENKGWPAEFQREQAPEQILAFLKRAFEEAIPVDLIIENSDGLKFTPDLSIVDIDTVEGYLMATYKDKNGEWGNIIPLELKRVKKANLGPMPKVEKGGA